MSLDLDIKITKEVKFYDLLVGCRNELIKLTNFEDIPYIQAYQMKSGIKFTLEEDYLLKPDELLVFKFKDISDEVSMVITVIKPFPPYIMENEADTWAGISVQGSSSIKIFLASGLALCLANFCNSVILDERMFWCWKRECTYDVFSNRLKINIKKNFNNLNFRDVCEIFFENIIKDESKKV